jgi:hypothetical protein
MHSHYDAMMARYQMDCDENMQLRLHNPGFFRRFSVGDTVRYLISTYPFDTLKKYIPRFTREVYVVRQKDGNKYLLSKAREGDQVFPLLPRRFSIPELIHAYSTRDENLTPNQREMLQLGPADDSPAVDADTPAAPVPPSVQPPASGIPTPPANPAIPLPLPPPSPTPPPKAVPRGRTAQRIDSTDKDDEADEATPPSKAVPRGRTAQRIDSTDKDDEATPPPKAVPRGRTAQRIDRTDDEEDDGGGGADNPARNRKQQSHDRNNRKISFAIRALRDTGMSPEDIAEKMGFDYDVVINELDPLTPPDPGPPHYYRSATIRRNRRCYAIYLYLFLHGDGYTDVDIYTILAEMGLTHSINAYMKLRTTLTDKRVSLQEALEEYATDFGGISAHKAYVEKWLRDHKKPDAEPTQDVERRRERIRQLFAGKDPETVAKNQRRYPQFTHEMLVDALGDRFEGLDTSQPKHSKITKREREIRDAAFEKIWNEAPDTKKLTYHDFLKAPYAIKAGALTWMAKKRKHDPKFPGAKKRGVKPKDPSSLPDPADLEAIVKRKKADRERHYQRHGSYPPELTADELKKVAKRRKTHREYLDRVKSEPQEKKPIPPQLKDLAARRSASKSSSDRRSASSSSSENLLETAKKLTESLAAWENLKRRKK